jgi:uncharacterized protein (TIGR03083 family)
MTDKNRDLIATLRTLHDRLAALTVDLGPDQLRERSYATEWSVADVLSHLGSGAELALIRLRSTSPDSPTAEESAQVWATWDSWTEEQQAVESIAADRAYVAALEAADDGTVDGLTREFPGMSLDAAQTLGLRVAEHAMHGWDIAVALDEDAALPEVAVPAVLGVLPLTLRWAAQPHDGELRVRISTTDPDGDYLLEIVHGETRLTPVDGDQPVAAARDGELQLPAEALLRLFYGRLDPRHTPPNKTSDDGLLDTLRGIFRGF